MAPSTVETLSLHDALPIYAGRALAVVVARSALRVRNPPHARAAASRPLAQGHVLVRHRRSRFRRRDRRLRDRKSTRLNSSHLGISYAVFCLKKKNFPFTSL